MARTRHARGVLAGVLFIITSCGGSSSDDASAPPVAGAPSVPGPVAASCPAGVESGSIVPGSSLAPACDSSRFDLHPDIAYAPHADGLLDLLLPRDQTAPVPLVVWVHGGGWQSGSKSDRAQSSRLVCRGFALASIDYRLSSTAIFPAQIQDVKAAIRHLRANASLYGIDPQRIGIFGSSAGAHLATLAGVAQDAAEFEDATLGNGNVSSRVQAVVDWYGPTRLADMDEQLLAQGCAPGSAHHDDADSAESRLLGCTVGDPACAAAARIADPSTYVDITDPPHLIMHGTADCVSPAAQSEIFAATLTAAGACAVHRPVPGAGHGGAQWMSPQVQDAVADFLERALAPGQSGAFASLSTSTPGASITNPATTSTGMAVSD